MFQKYIANYFSVFVVILLPKWNFYVDAGYIKPQNSCNEGFCFPEPGDLLNGRRNQLTVNSFVPNHEIWRVIKGHQTLEPQWWESETNQETVEIQLNLETEFELYFIFIDFLSSVPGLMYIERSRDFGRRWQLYQIFSSNCSELPNDFKDELPCTDAKSGYAYGTEKGGRIHYRPLGNVRRVADPYTLSNQHQRIITNLRIVLLKFPNERENHYAISTMMVYGACLCYGHASSCTSLKENVMDYNYDHKINGLCECQHNTIGYHCDKCKEGYNKYPWRSSSQNQPFECERLN